VRPPALRCGFLLCACGFLLCACGFLLCACGFLLCACGFLLCACGFLLCACLVVGGLALQAAHHAAEAFDEVVAAKQLSHALKKAESSVLHGEVDAEDPRRVTPRLRNDRLVAPRVGPWERPTSDALVGAVVDEILRDSQARVALDVAHKVLLAVAVVKHLQHHVGPAAFVGYDPCEARVVFGLRHVAHREDVGREALLSRVHHGHLLGEVHHAAHGLEVKPQEVHRAHFCLLVGASLGHRVARVGQGVEHPHQKRLPRLGRHGGPGFQRGAHRDGQTRRLVDRLVGG
jgi:hypothetical protein